MFMLPTKMQFLKKLHEQVKGSNKASSLMASAAQGVRSMASDVPSAWPGRAVAEEVKTRSGPKPISLIGSTGSISTQTLDIVAENPEKFKIVALAAGSNVTLLAEQVQLRRPSTRPMNQSLKHKKF